MEIALDGIPHMFMVNPLGKTKSQMEEGEWVGKHREMKGPCPALSQVLMCLILSWWCLRFIKRQFCWHQKNRNPSPEPYMVPCHLLTWDLLQMVINKRKAGITRVINTDHRTGEVAESWRQNCLYFSTFSTLITWTYLGANLSFVSCSPSTALLWSWVRKGWYFTHRPRSPTTWAFIRQVQPSVCLVVGSAPLQMLVIFKM